MLFLVWLFPHLHNMVVISASYAGIQDWTDALEDAKECIKLNPQFVKGYYRLGIAQLELKDYTGAHSTIKRGLSFDTNNPQLLKVLKSIRQRQQQQQQSKRTGVSSATSGQQSASPNNNSNNNNNQYSNIRNNDLDVATIQEVRDLQVQYESMVREYQSTQVDLQRAQREERMYSITSNELFSSSSSSVSSNHEPSTPSSSLSDKEKENNNNNSTTTNNNNDHKKMDDDNRSLYRSVGKLFLKSTSDQIIGHITDNITTQQTKQRDCTARIEYIQKRINSIQLNIRELTGGAGGSGGSTGVVGTDIAGPTTRTVVEEKEVEEEENDTPPDLVAVEDDTRQGWRNTQRRNHDIINNNNNNSGRNDDNWGSVMTGYRQLPTILDE